jgi:hypothetical protein
MSAETAVRLPRLGDRIIYRTHGGEDHAAMVTGTKGSARSKYLEYLYALESETHVHCVTFPPMASLLRATHVPYDGEVGPPDGESGGQHSWRYSDEVTA